MDRFLISFPRSGQHLVERIIRRVSQAHGYPYSYCDYYNCCRHLPCARTKLLQKNHDFDLQIDRTIGRFFVLYRADPILQLDAWYRWTVGRKSGEYNHLLQPDRTWWTTEEHLHGLTRFATRQIGYYRNFVAKWVNAHLDTVASIDYQTFLDSPEDSMKLILGHLFPDRCFAVEVVAAAVRAENPSPRNEMPAEFYELAHERLGPIASGGN